MIEPFRHLVDRSIFEIQDSIRKSDYIFSRDGVVILSDQLRQRYIDLLTSIRDRKKRVHGEARNQNGRCLSKNGSDYYPENEVYWTEGLHYE